MFDNVIASRIMSAILTATPTCIFVCLNTTTSLKLALTSTVVASFLILIFRLIMREEIFHAILGAILAAIGAGIASLTGESRGFFLLPSFIPLVCALVFFGSVVVRRPLAGVVLNSLAGGPAHWYDYKPLQELFTYATLIAAGINAASAVWQRFLYIENQTTLLGIIHIVSIPTFGALFGITFFLAKARVSLYKKDGRSNDDLEVRGFGKRR